ncbi:DUF5000 domain-containing lipoprotein [Parabacteroides pacaensis]|uniref:DUF5000 domain-containing lipoprotein n=1 Tax=Parabacteroides pacaensis TaxID=2086575 RepID=UPI000D0F1E51|nr:DUF5000 domain-containing lipoprotein [Parabacteroides pacaensis]
MKTKYLKLITLALIVCSCSEKQLEPITASLGKPGVVTEVQTEPIAGGVIVSYRIPNSEDILAVKGVYTITTGKKMETSASFYENKLFVEGYNDTLPHEVLLYAVNRAQELSDPVKVSFTPLESSLSKVTKTMQIISDFGGAQYNWRNVDKAPLTMEFLAQDSLGLMQTAKIITTESDSSRQSIRGYQPEPRLFAAIVRDNYGNASDTIYPPEGNIIPLFEEKLDKRKMNVMKLSNDASFTNWEGMDSYLIDDDPGTFGHSANSSLPASFTVDLGQVAKLSRIVMFQRKYSDSYYNWGNPLEFTVYGCDKKPSQDGNWNEWTKIMECEIIKPSGSPSGTTTDEDLVAGEEGHEFTFDLSQVPLRYIRVTVTSTWGGTTFTHPAEVDFYGEAQE